MNKWIVELTASDDEIWHYDEVYNTREEAIKGGTELAKDEGGECFRIGEMIPYDVPGIDAELVIERMQETVYEEIGEAADDYLNNIKEEHENELEEKLTQVFTEWAKKYSYNSTFYKVVNDEFIEVK